MLIINAQLVRPILLDIIEIRDSIRRVSESFASKAEEERVVPLKTFSDYTFDIQDILEKNNIIIYDSKAKSDFPIKVFTKEIVLSGSMTAFSFATCPTTT